MDTGVVNVYVANYAGHDYAGTEKYGTLKHIVRGFISFQSLDRLKFQVATGVMDSKPDDWLVLSGTNIINVLAALEWFHLHKKVKILNYDKLTSEYRELIISEDNLTKMFAVMTGEE